MKFFMLMTLFTFVAYAGDEKLCDHLKKNTLKDHSASFGVDFKSEAGEVVAKVSHELNKKVEEQCKSGSLRAVKDYDSCSSSCVTIGSPDFGRKPPKLGGSRITKLSRECQQYCKSYQLSAFAFEDGAESNVEFTPKCGAHVNDDQFGTHKSDLAERVKGQIKIQSQASGQ